MSKYRRLRDRLIASPVHFGDVFLEPPAATIQQLSLAHDHDYVQRVVQGELTDKELKRIGFPWSAEMVERSCRSSGATLAAARVALGEGIAVNLAGGTHHAMRGAGEGYCVFNDSAVTIRTLQAEGLIQRACVIDCDVHQGNGTAEILGEDSNVFTFSIHCAKNFPSRKHPSHLDVDLQEGTGDMAYLAQLEQGLAQVMSAWALRSSDLSCRCRPLCWGSVRTLGAEQGGVADARSLGFGCAYRAGDPNRSGHGRRLRTRCQ